MNMNFPIADVQSILDTRRIAINRAGIRAIRHPVRIADKDDGIQHTIAVFNMYVNLPHQFQRRAYVALCGDTQQPRA